MEEKGRKRGMEERRGARERKELGRRKGMKKADGRRKRWRKGGREGEKPERTKITKVRNVTDSAL